MSKEIVNVEQDNEITLLVKTAIEGKASPETLEKLFTLRQKVKAEQAKAAFVTAMADFQGQCPVIKKTKKVLNKDGTTTRYMYAPIDSIVEQIKKPLSDNHLSYTWTVKNDEGFMTAIVMVTHSFGHSETSEFKVPIDKEGYMTAPQKYASALTFAKRYSLCNALGISTGDDDTDAVDVGKEKEAKSIKAKIVLLLRQLGHVSKDKEVLKGHVLKLTQLELVDKNFEDIVSRLQILVDEQNADKEIQ